MRGTPADLIGLVGQRVLEIRQRGKFLLIDLDVDRVVINPMRGEAASQDSPGRSLRSAARRPGGPRDAATWTTGASWLSGIGASTQVRFRDPTQMGKVYLLPAGLERPIPGLGPNEIGRMQTIPTRT